jgi:hypothetical protein
MRTQLRLNPDAVSWREIDGEVLALGHASSTYLSTTGSGALLWRSLTAGTTREELVALVVREYGIDETQAAADIDAFLESLSVQGLLVA